MTTTIKPDATTDCPPTKKKPAGTINLTPTWETAASIHLMAFESGTPAGKEAGRAGIMEMANACDTLNERVRKMATHIERLENLQRIKTEK